MRMGSTIRTREESPCYTTRKTYHHNLGLSCCFRQWRAKSHCRLVHGYALSFEFVFSAASLSPEGWVMDFGNLKRVEAWLREHFDHTCLIAADDPELPTFQKLAEQGLIRLITPTAVGCEAFARWTLESCQPLIADDARHVQIKEVLVREHGANAAGFAVRS